MKVLIALLVSLVVLLPDPSHAEHEPMDDAEHHSSSETNAASKRHGPTSLRKRKRPVKTTRVIVEFANDAGMDHAVRLSTKVYHQSLNRRYLAVEIESSLVQELADNENITNIQSDGFFYEQGYLEKEVSLEEHHDRKLFQTTPYGITMVQADQVDVGQSPVRVCIADTGTLAQHPDLPISLMKGENRVSSFDTELKWRRDRRGHGTHVAGTVSATDNGYGVRGVGQIPLYITRALNDAGQARESDLIEAIEECRNSGARVISLSIGGGGMSSALSDLLTSLYQEGFLIFGASGNNGENAKMYPAAHSLVVAVGAVQPDYTIWPSSNYGNWIELTGPGKSIYSTTTNSLGQSLYAYYSGTSMATPHVAAVAALVWSHFPQCTNTQIRYALAKSAVDLGGSGCDQYFGYGVVQAKSAIDWLTKNPCNGATYGKGTVNGGCSLLQSLST
ncbi:hypothetical protein MPSEU_000191600 [Mayamaea pseudoterrestris]|nr:hypothetical protein MPSEU_000191600 [Mayamaea pseudoterrestris]